MKKLILGLSTLCLIFFTSCKDNASGKVDQNKVTEAVARDAKAQKFPKIEFDKKEHDFGELISGTKVETIFKYKNTGDAPLVITDIKSSCGCTIPKNWTKEPLAPGAEGQFSVNFNGKGANKVSKTVTVTANTEKGKETVRITAFVKPDPNKKVAAPNSIKGLPKAAK